ncbi:MAG: heme NO-binding domain-containing protein [Planctomycetaceae bacterium]|nr:heme NO-binding domain-containing protein [Planctomycetaceae bacterium]
MKGIVFTLFNELVERSFGLETWDRLLQQSGEDGIYTAAATYPDQSMLSMVTALAKQTSVPAGQLVRTFGEYMLSGFVRQYPTFFPDGMTARQLLLSVDSIIHVEVKKLFPDAVLPKFTYECPSDDRLIMTYQSQRRLCSLAEGLIDGTARHFGQEIQRVQTCCMNDGAEFCRFELTFGKQSA